jgi:hypothetical protein
VVLWVLQVRAQFPVPPADPGLQISATISSSPPPHAAFRMGGRLFLESTQYALEAVEGFRPHFTSPPASCPAGRAILHPLSGQDRLLHRSRGGSPPFQGGHKGSSTLSSAFLLHQFHLSHTEKGRGYAHHIELEEAECSAAQHPFRMETVEDVRHALRQGDWAASVDLRDAYFHVPLHHSTKKYMCFGWRGCLYRFVSSPSAYPQLRRSSQL